MSAIRRTGTAQENTSAMRLDEIDVSLILRAIDVYLRHAWGDLADSHRPKFAFEAKDREALLRGFADSSRQGGMRKYTLRLGNRRYPFMKIVLQELLVRESFFFAVDTHDALDIKETTPDYAEWLAIREYNARVKEAVEREWRSLGVPTFQDVVIALERQEVPEEQCSRATVAPLIHVVEDDQSIAHGVHVILRKRRYAVEVSHSAEEALPKLEKRRPDLVLSDLEMGSGYTGLQLCEQVRRTRGLETTPFILATASGLDLRGVQSVDGFLVKPYDIDVLMTFIGKHLAAGPRTGSAS